MPPSSDIAHKLLADGQLHYRAKRFQEAIETFNKLLVQSKDDARALDMRAAAYEKLGRHRDALQDAQRMIRLCESDPRGYLRAGKNLEFCQKHDLAFKIYARGLASCEKTDPNYQLLMKVAAKVSKIVSPPTAADFLTILPNEIIDLIFSYVPFGSLCRCLNVSKTWRSFLTSLPFLWRTVDLSKAKRGVRLSAFTNYSKYASGNVERAILRGLELQGSKALQSFAKQNPRLQFLHLLSGGSLQNSLIGASKYIRSLRSLHLSHSVIVPVTALYQAIANLKSLEELEVPRADASSFRSWSELGSESSLKRLNLGLDGYDPIGHPSTRLLLTKALPISESLEYLKINSDVYIFVLDFDQMRLQNLSSLELPEKISSDPLQEAVNLPVTIRQLTLTSGSTRGSPLIHIGISTGLPKLRELTFRGFCPPWDWLNALLNTRPLLADQSAYMKLDMLSSFCCDRMIYEEHEVAWILSHPRLSKLRQLNIQDAGSFDDSHAEQIGDTMKDLQQVDLSTSRITGVGVKRLVEKLPGLQKMVLRHCRNISVDAIQWARSKNVIVIYSME